MAFRFSLAAVLMVRENGKKRAEQDLRTIQLEIDQVAQQIENLNTYTANTHKARESAMQQPIPGGELHSFEHRVKAIAEARKGLLDRLQILELERERRMNIYHAAHRDLETIVEMLDEQRTAYDQEQSRNEQKQLDDIFAAHAVKETNHNN
ncbi:MAG: flagellar export protein FliJ [Terracidiphilus sp.]|jgi:flagellar export protein FliJ